MSNDISPNPQKRYRSPSMISGEGTRLSEGEVNLIREQLSIQRKDAACSWCGDTRWWLSDTVYTHTAFDITNNHHVLTLVRPYIVTTCAKCGNEQQFSLYMFGLAANGVASDKATPDIKGSD